MITSYEAIYEGDGVFRTLKKPIGLTTHQQVQLNVWLPEIDFEWDEPYNPNPDSIRRAMGSLEVQDRALAERLAFSPEFALENVFLHDLSFFILKPTPNQHLEPK